MRGEACCETAVRGGTRRRAVQRGLGARVASHVDIAVGVSHGVRFTKADALCMHNTWLVTRLERTSAREHAWSKPAQSAFARRHLSNSAAIETGRTARRQEKRMSMVESVPSGRTAPWPKLLQGARKDAARLSQPYCKRPFSSAYKGS